MPYSGLRARVEEGERHERLREAGSLRAQRELESFVDLDVPIRDVVKPSFPAALKREISGNESLKNATKKGTEGPPKIRESSVSLTRRICAGPSPALP